MSEIKKCNFHYTIVKFWDLSFTFFISYSLFKSHYKVPEAREDPLCLRLLSLLETFSVVGDYISTLVYIV